VLVVLVVLSALVVTYLMWLAYQLGRRGSWARLRAGADQDPWRAFVQLHQLSPSDAPRVAHAVPRGLVLEEPHLRVLAVDWAERLVERETVRRPTSRKGRILAGAGVLWILCALGFLLYRVLTGRLEDVNWVTVAVLACFLVGALRRRCALRRAIALNSGAPGS
jgi:cell division protein FtsL